MPTGMFLKSDGFASSLYDPDSAFTLGHYCAEKNLPYADVGIPVPLETFAAYGLEFLRKRLNPGWGLETDRNWPIELSTPGIRIDHRNRGTFSSY